MPIAIILAAGSGTRFGKNSKLLADLWGSKVIEYPVEFCKEIGITDINVVVSNPSEFEFLNVDLDDDKDHKNKSVNCTFHQQNSNVRGTGAAVKSVISGNVDDAVVVLLGDSPIVDKQAILRAIDNLQDHAIVIGGFKCGKPNNYGRIKIENDKVISIEEAKVQPGLSEFSNAGWFVCDGQYLHSFLDKIPKINNEYYLTECVRIATEMGFSVAMEVCVDHCSINTREDYMLACDVVQKWLRKRAINKGARLLDVNSVFFSHGTAIAQDVVIGPNVVFEGTVILGEGVKINPFSYLENSSIGSNSVVGPFASIRQQTYLEHDVEIGSFVEAKRSTVGARTKAKHLSYIGDAEIGDDVNIGAGAVFCNYDGKQKYKSKIGDQSFLGANTSYIAPIEIGRNVQTGAGSVITKNVEDDALAVSRAKQKNYRRKV